jgi:hypothetical protein
LDRPEFVFEMYFLYRYLAWGLSYPKYFLSPASLEFAKGTEKSNYFLIAVERTAMKNQLGAKAPPGRRLRGFWLPSPSTAAKKKILLCVLCELERLKEAGER